MLFHSVWFTSAAYQKGTPYGSLSECSSKKEQYDKQYLSYERSTCFKEGGSYLYIICNKWEWCAQWLPEWWSVDATWNSQSSVNIVAPTTWWIDPEPATPIMMTGGLQSRAQNLSLSDYKIPVKYKKALDKRLFQLSKSDIKTLEKVQTKVKGLLPKFRKSKLGTDILWYFFLGIEKIIEEKKQMEILILIS